MELYNQTYGKDVNSVLKEIMGVNERPNDLIELFGEFYLKKQKHKTQ